MEEHRLPSVPFAWYSHGLFDDNWVLTDVPQMGEWKGRAICLPFLQSLGQHGRILFWQGGFDGAGHIYTRSGSYRPTSSTPPATVPSGEGTPSGVAINPSGVTTPEGTPSGGAIKPSIDGLIETTRTPVLMNQTSRDVYENGVIQLRKKHTEQVRKGYTANVSELVVAKKKEPMLATIYRDGSNPSFPATSIPGHLFGQVKLMGQRMLMSMKDGVIYCRSRKDVAYPFLLHIKYYAPPIFSYLPNGIELDGEVYLHGISQQELTTLVSVGMKTYNPDEVKVYYYIFDITLNVPYNQRYAILEKAMTDCRNDGNPLHYITLLPYFEIQEHDDTVLRAKLKSYRDYYIQQGYEGIVMRRADVGYHYGRTVKLYKYKERDDDEGKVIDIKESEKVKGIPILVVSYKGIEFDLSMNGTEKYQRELFQNRQQYIGEMVTFTYTGFTQKGIPKEARGVAFRNYEG